MLPKFLPDRLLGDSSVVCIVLDVSSEFPFPSHEYKLHQLNLNQSNLADYDDSAFNRGQPILPKPNPNSATSPKSPGQRDRIHPVHPSPDAFWHSRLAFAGGVGG